MIHPRDTDANPPIWTLDLEVAGTTLRYSSRPVEVSGERYRGGLPSVVVEEQLDLLGQEPEAPSVSLGLVSTDPVARWVSQGHRIERGFATLRWQVPGAGVEKSEVAVVGTPLAGAYGAPGEPLSLTVEAVGVRAGEKIQPEATYTTGSVPAAVFVEPSAGKAYPVIFGQPFEWREAVVDGVGVLRAKGYATEAIPTRLEVGEPTKYGELAIAAGWLPKVGEIVLAWRDCADPADDGSAVVSLSHAQHARDNLNTRYTRFDLIDLETETILTAAQRTAKKWYVRWVDAVGGDAGQNGGSLRTRYISFTGGADQNIEVERLPAGATVEYLWYAVPSAPSGAGVKTYSVEISPFRGADVVFFSLGSADINAEPTKTFTPGPPIRLDAPCTLRAKVDTLSTDGQLQLGYKVRYPPADTAKNPSTLGGCLRWLAGRSGQRTALDRWDGVAPYLNVPVAGALDGTKAAWAVLMEDMLPLAPVSLMTGEGGIYPVLWRWWASVEQAEYALTVGRDGVVRLPDVRAARTHDEVATEVSLAYAYDAESGSFARRAVLTSDMTSPGEFEKARRAFRPRGVTLGSTVAGRAFPGRRVETESRFVYSALTAQWFCRWRLAAEGWAHRVVEVEGRASLGAVPLGALVAFTDERTFIDNALAFVVGRRRTDTGRCGLRLAFIDSVQATNPVPGPTADKGPPWRLGGPNPEPQQ